MRRLSSCLGILFLAGCASERVVLLPSADGHASALVVKTARGENLLDQPYQATLRQGSGIQTYRASADDVQQRFGQALAAQPPRAKSFVVYFDLGSDNLAAEAQAQIDLVKAEVQGRSAAEVTVIGHTDRVGSVQANDALSLKRAAKVREVLVAAGLSEKVIETAGRGEREPLVPTEDEVAEPRNRRVEISVR